MQKRRQRKPPTPEQRAWGQMFQRCYNPNVPSYAGCGALGVQVCPRWRVFENFFVDMGPRPSKSHQLGRKEIHKDFSPDNCAWMTRFEIMNNCRKNRFIEYNGQRMTVTQWARVTGVGRKNIHHRIKSGWSTERTLFTLPEIGNATREKALAHSAICLEIRTGRLPPAKTKKCLRCGRQAQSYHHNQGYDKAHWLSVIPLCRDCHEFEHHSRTE